MFCVQRIHYMVSLELEQTAPQKQLLIMTVLVVKYRMLQQVLQRYFVSAGKVQHLRAAFNVDVNRNSLYSCNLGYHQNLDEHCVKNICTCANGQTKVDCVSNNKHCHCS